MRGGATLDAVCVWGGRVHWGGVTLVDLRGGTTLETERVEGRCACTGEWERERSKLTVIEPRDRPPPNDLIGYYHQTDMRMRMCKPPL